MTWSVANATFGADPDLGRAEQLVRDGSYQEAYDLLAPFEDATSGDPNFAYLLGRAALGTERADRAKALFERSLAARPDSIAARLALGRAYFALGQYAEAKIEFETVLRFDNLPPDLLTQVDIYNEAAQQYLEQNRRLLGFGYAELGVGRYRVNSTRATGTFGGDDRRDTFYNARVGGGLNYEIENDYALDASLDYRFRYYDNPDSRNDSDWRWHAAVSRAFGESNLAVGVQGKVSYRGDGQYRNDYGVFTDWRYRLDPDNQVSLGAELRTRTYPNGPLRSRSRDIAEATAGWIRALAGGRASFSIIAHGGYEWATQQRSDGDASFYGATAKLDVTLSDRVGGFVFAWWQRDSYTEDLIRFHPDSLDDTRVGRRDNLYEFGGGLVWEFAKGWSLRPEILYIRDQSNVLSDNYGSTEVWLNVRKGF